MKTANENNPPVITAFNPQSLIGKPCRLYLYGGEEKDAIVESYGLDGYHGHGVYSIRCLDTGVAYRFSLSIVKGRFSDYEKPLFYTC